MTDAQPVLGEELPPFKFVFHRHRARSGAAARGGLSRPLAYIYLFSQLSLKDWVIFNDLYSVPMRVGKYKAGATPDDIAKLKQAVFNLGTDAAAVLSDSTMVELLETKNRAGDVPTPSKDSSTGLLERPPKSSWDTRALPSRQRAGWAVKRWRGKFGRIFSNTTPARCKTP